MTDQPTAEQLLKACDALVQRRRVKVDGLWRNVDSLLQQLAAADSYSGAGGSSVAKSRAPVNTSVLALLIDVGDTARRQLVDLHDPVRRRGFDIVKNLRAATSLTIGCGEPDEWSAWLGLLQRWRTSARAELRLDAGRRQWLRGLCCPACGASTASHPDPDSRQLVHSSALSVSWVAPPEGQDHIDEAWMWDAVTCKACRMRWDRGGTLPLLLSALRRAGVIDGAA